MRRHRVSWLLVALTLTVAAGCTRAPRSTGAADEIDRRIQFYAGKLEQRPRLYPVYVQLATAYLDKARETSDARWLADARRTLERSLAIVETYEAFVMMARVANHAHRFEEAIRWGRRAGPGTKLPGAPDPVVVAILVEAHSALGQYAEARALLPPEGTAPGDLYTAAALAGWLSSQGRYEEAARAYDAAAGLARAANGTKAATWAQTMAAGALLDSGRAVQARVRLEAIRRIDPRDTLFRLHDAECLVAERRPAKALAVYEAMLEERPSDPEIRARAYKLARSLAETGRAQRHFEAAERGFREPIDAGQVHTLGALAQLYSDAGTHLDEAIVLAERNLRFRRDLEARAILAGAVRRLAAERAH